MRPKKKTAAARRARWRAQRFCCRRRGLFSFDVRPAEKVPDPGFEPEVSEAGHASGATAEPKPPPEGRCRGNLEPAQAVKQSFPGVAIVPPRGRERPKGAARASTVPWRVPLRP